MKQAQEVMRKEMELEYQRRGLSVPQSNLDAISKMDVDIKAKAEAPPAPGFQIVAEVKSTFEKQLDYLKEQKASIQREIDRERQIEIDRQAQVRNKRLEEQQRSGTVVTRLPPLSRAQSAT